MPTTNTIKESITAIEEPYPILNNPNDSLYIETANVSDRRAGPPAVITQIMSNTLKPPIMFKITTTVVVGFNNGKIICVNVFQSDAPSIFEASRTSLGIFCNPIKNSIILIPVICHVAAAIIANVLSGAFNNHVTGLSIIPIETRAELNSPVLEKIHFQIMKF